MSERIWTVEAHPGTRKWTTWSSWWRRRRKAALAAALDRHTLIALSNVNPSCECRRCRRGEIRFIGGDH